MSRFAPCLAGFVAAVVVAGFATVHAATFYAIDKDADELVTLDSETGEVVSVAPLGVDVADVDLARAGDTL